MSILLIYMPAFNEEETIFSVIQSIPKKVEGFSEIKILVVDDGSIDDTKGEALKAKATVINHIRNKGVGVAFQTAVNYALNIGADVLVSIDADGQFNVDEIQKMVYPITNSQADFCIGNRFAKGKPERMSTIKYWGNKKVNKIIGFISKVKINDASCGFRAYSKECLLNLNLQGNFTYTHETILDLLNKDLTLKQQEVSVTYFEERVSRVASNVISYGFKTLKIILKCLKDYTPFYFFFTIAMFVFVIAIAIGGFVFVHWMSEGAITPYKSFGFIALSLVGVSVILTTLALVADMIGRTRKNQEKILYYLKKSHFD